MHNRYPCWPPLQAEYHPLCQTVVAMLQRDFTEQLHSIYLYGSVAQAQACIGQSDIDFCVIFHKPLSNMEIEKLKHLQTVLEQKFKLLSKIDIDIGDLHTIARPDQQRRWQFWLQHLCRPLFGPNLMEEFAPIAVNYQLVWEINDGYQEDLSHYFEKLSEGIIATTDLIKNYKSLIKRLIRLLPLS
ncbi:nucleotidyltransferase domain-containing protein [Acinetobacter larvae]|uniref:Polymerase beta nucleotidyltransferase domain-containing protein n=1 Tax=Acinetobacter larvae TaxID=1789224 RepID=A0A1B2LWK5_9GAMM|nr:nucleotidyltransferase domain-containing protein [Acinetobacter larvae]AOA57326.1 hypothetical protein BFG52_02445 [Acinetobacter larvae]